MCSLRFQIGRWALTLGAATLATWCLGCTSARTTIHGDPSCQHPRKHLHGVPTNVEIPTHVKIVIQEKYYLAASDNQVVKAAGVPVVARAASYEIIRKKELFAVDCKRPAAGIIKYKYAFDSNTQQLTGFETGVTDVTIEKVSDLVDQLIRTAPLLARQQTNTQTTTAPLATEITSDVACAFFDIHDPDLTSRIQQFLAHYVNDCPPNCPVDQLMQAPAGGEKK